MQSALPILTKAASGDIAVADPLGTFRLEGQLIDASDTPVGGGRVTIDALPPRATTTEADGTFVFEGLLARDYTLAAIAEAGAAGPV
ncbi:MAG TPA: carboxypeptidase-like regulatory domain-containing protein, partial [Kofleriaceae bacterium]|nr:carboxypeptidase-like regulatory domain-containing protein [Kofleriaceae bacterium]